MKVLRRGLAMLLVLVLLLPILCVPAFAEDSADVSFYEMASVASAHLSDVLARSEKEDGSVTIKGVTSGSIGGFLGYSDEIDESNFFSKWVSSKLSTSSATLSYESLQRISGGENGDGYAYAYLKYGQLLNRIGFDSTGNSGNHILRVIGGSVMVFVYNVARFLPNVFNAVIKILEFLNPFRMIDTGYDIADLEYEGRGTGPLQGLANVMAKIYKAIYDHIAGFIFLWLFVVLVVTLLFSNLNAHSGMARNAWPLIKKFLIRGVAMFLGVPLCASLYSTSLNWLDEMSDDKNFAASRIIASTFIDFEEWARQYQLAVPKNNSGFSGARLSFSNHDNGTISSTTYLNLQASCYNINQASWAKAGKIGSPDSVNFGGGITNNALIASLESKSELVHEGTEDVGMADVIDDLLERYSHGDFYYPGSWETDARAEYTLQTVEGLEDVLRSSSKVSSFRENVVEAGLFGADGEDKFWGSSGVLSGVGPADETDRGSKPMNFNVAGRLSAMALYNYLSSDFGGNSLTIYSNEQASSGFVRKSHFSVNLIGGGLLGFLFYLDSLVLIFVMAFIGFFYAMAVLFANIKRTFVVFVAAFGTVSGSIKMFAKLLTFVIVAILEIIGTMGAYFISTEMLLSLNQLIISPLLIVMSRLGTGSSAGDIVVGTNVGIISATVGNFFGVAAKPVLMVCLVVNIIIMILFTVVACKVRKQIVKSIEEVASAFIDKVLGVQHTPLSNGSPGLAGRLAGAGIAGVGAAAGQRLFGGGSAEASETTKGTASAEQSDGSAPPDGKSGSGEQRDTKSGESAGEETKTSQSDSDKSSADPSLNEDTASDAAEQQEKDAAEQLMSEGSLDSPIPVAASESSETSSEESSEENSTDKSLDAIDDKPVEEAKNEDDKKPAEAEKDKSKDDGQRKDIAAEPVDKSKDDAKDKNKSKDKSKDGSKTKDVKAGDPATKTDKNAPKTEDEKAEPAKPAVSGEAGKSENKKPGDKKSEDKKAGDKKPDEGKSGQPKPVESSESGLKKQRFDPNAPKPVESSESGGSSVENSETGELDNVKPVAESESSGVAVDNTQQASVNPDGGVEGSSDINSDGTKPVEQSSESTVQVGVNPDGTAQVGANSDSTTQPGVSPDITGSEGTGTEAGVNNTGSSVESSKPIESDAKPADGQKSKRSGRSSRRTQRKTGKPNSGGRKLSDSPVVGQPKPVESESSIDGSNIGSNDGAAVLNGAPDMQPAAPAALNVEPTDTGVVMTPNVDGKQVSAPAETPVETSAGSSPGGQSDMPTGESLGGAQGAPAGGSQVESPAVGEQVDKQPDAPSEPARTTKATPIQRVTDTAVAFGKELGHNYAAVGKAVVSAPGKAADAVKAAPGKVVKVAKEAPGKIVTTVKEAPGKIKAAPGKVAEKVTSTVDGMSDAQKAAAIAFATTMMSTSQNSVISQTGQAMQTGATMAMMQKGRQQQNPSGEMGSSTVCDEVSVDMRTSETVEVVEKPAPDLKQTNPGQAGAKVQKKNTGGGAQVLDSSKRRKRRTKTDGKPKKKVLGTGIKSDAKDLDDFIE